MARILGSLNGALRGLQIIAGVAPEEAPMVSHQMMTRATTHIPNSHPRSYAHGPRGQLSDSLSARPAFSFFNKDGPGKTLVIMGGGKSHRAVTKVESKGPREGWDDDIH
ncbi:hypothetical protein GTA08_BOTSDO03385 [Botryosphaeria dothidea]|uniref:Uncharacterized protein n=1 Tax=Botryosphaeria dothidea TaxID=55169 RepID=A0A8H4N8J9_9PEZI|nr:hypothetical protein GTA08_BOTSDO03385 [Botryosphaeria dothidea]